MPIGITDMGIYVPKNKVTNDDLSKTLDTNDEWISTRTGIKIRYIADKDENTIDLAFSAVQALIKSSGKNLDGVDLIICSTVTNEYRFPAISALIQKKLEIPDIPTFDCNVGCAGYLYVMSIAESYVKSGAAKKVLCIVAEKLSSILDWTDRNTCVLFGDAAGAFLIEDSPDAHEIIKCTIGGDGAFSEMLSCKMGGLVSMDGAGVFKNAIRFMEREVRKVCELAQVKVSDIDLLVPHQANLRIISAVGEKLEIPLEKTMINVEKYANTSCVTISLALEDALKENRLKKGDLVGLVAMGAGFAWGAALVRW